MIFFEEKHPLLNNIKLNEVLFSIVERLNKGIAVQKKANSIVYLKSHYNVLANSKLCS